MKEHTFLFPVLLLLSVVTHAEEPPKAVDESAVVVPDPASEEVEELLRDLKIIDRHFAVVPRGSSLSEDSPNYSGEWIVRDGERSCDGYLTRNSTDEFCSKEVPEDWRRFEFNGETYYVAPIVD